MIRDAHGCIFCMYIPNARQTHLSVYLYLALDKPIEAISISNLYFFIENMQVDMVSAHCVPYYYGCETYRNANNHKSRSAQ